MVIVMGIFERQLNFMDEIESFKAREIKLKSNLNYKD